MYPVSQASRHAEECRQLARALTSEEQSRQKQRHDNGTPPPEFAAGSLVWLWIPSTVPGLAQKLLSKYHDPYRVIERASPVNYVVEPLTLSPHLRCRGRETVHVDRLKAYHEPMVLSCP